MFHELHANRLHNTILFTFTEYLLHAKCAFKDKKLMLQRYFPNKKTFLYTEYSNLPGLHGKGQAINVTYIW